MRRGLRRCEVGLEEERTEKGEEPCLRTACGKSPRCETEKRVRSIVSSHVHACAVASYLTRARARTCESVYARMWSPIRTSPFALREMRSSSSRMEIV